MDLQAPKKPSRSKTGCSRCKLKRLKCDETKPGCLQCRKRRQSCPGYQRPIRWAADYPHLMERSNRSVRQRSSDPNASQTDMRDNLNRESTSNLSHLADATYTLGRENPQLPSTASPPSRPNALTGSPSQRVETPLAILVAAAANADSPADSGIRVEHDQSTSGALVLASLRDEPSFSHANGTRSCPQPLPPFRNIESASASPFSDAAAEAQRSDVTAFSLEHITEEDNFLLQNYFTDVCRLNSAFDSPTNPFRYMISELIVDSPLIFNCVLSLSARWEVQRNERFLSTAVHRHSAAVGYLSDILLDIRRRDASLEQGSRQLSSRLEYEQIKQAILASILLGISSSWLDSSDNGMQHLLGARRLFAKWQTIITGDYCAIGDPWSPLVALCDPDKSFIIGALAYWEALLSFVVDQPVNSLDYLKPFCDQSNLEKVPLNPWSGICTPVFVYLGQVGILARQKRLSLKMQAVGWSSSMDMICRDMLTAASTVERQILDYRVPPKSKTCDTGDPQTSLAHLIHYAHCYQITSLLELYRSFPELLWNQTPVDGAFARWQFAPLSSPGHIDAQRFCENPKQAHRNLILDMSGTLLWLINGAPENCGLSTGHTLAIIICGSVLYNVPEDANSDGQDRTVAGLLSSIAMSPAFVKKWRESLQARIRLNSRVTGLKSFEQVEELLDAVWSKMDDACSLKSSDTDDPLDIHWLDVMAECKLESVYG